MSHVNISDFEENNRYSGIYVCRDHSLRTSKTGSLFLSVTIADNSGIIEGKMFNVTPDINERIENGSLISVDLKVQTYNGAKSVVFEYLDNPMRVNTEDLRYILPIAPVPANTMYEEMYSTADSFSNPELKDVVTTVLLENEKMLKKIPAAKSMHHAFIGGLAFHEGSMLRLAKKIVEAYPVGTIDKDLLFSGVILHDIKKIEEFETSKIGLVTDYSKRGKLLGHIVMGTAYVGEVCDRLGISEETKLLLQHMILAHHGTPEFGSPVKPMFLEAYLLNMIDNIDAKLFMYRDAIKSVEPGQFSEKIWGLDNISVYRKIHE